MKSSLISVKGLGFTDTCTVVSVQLVQWKLPSLQCMGSEQLSLFADRSAFTSVTISMRMLRRCVDTRQLLLLYRHCSKELAQIILQKLRQPHTYAASAASQTPITEEKRIQQRDWARALAAGVCTREPQEQEQQQQLPQTHSACLLGAGAACIIDTREALHDTAFPFLSGASESAKGAAGGCRCFNYWFVFEVHLVYLNHNELFERFRQRLVCCGGMRQENLRLCFLRGGRYVREDRDQLFLQVVAKRRVLKSHRR